MDGRIISGGRYTKRVPPAIGASVPRRPLEGIRICWEGREGAGDEGGGIIVISVAPCSLHEIRGMEEQRR